MRKKLLTVILATIMVCSLTACGSKEEAPVENEAEIAEETVAEAEVEAENEVLTEEELGEALEKAIEESENEDKSNRPHRIDDISDEDMAILVGECYDELSRNYEHTSTVEAIYMFEDTESFAEDTTNLYFVLNTVKSDGAQEYNIAVQNVVKYNEEGKIESGGTEISMIVPKSVDEAKSEIIEKTPWLDFIDEKVYN